MYEVPAAILAVCHSGRMKKPPALPFWQSEVLRERNGKEFYLLAEHRGELDIGHTCDDGQRSEESENREGAKIFHGFGSFPLDALVYPTLG